MTRKQLAIWGVAGLVLSAASAGLGAWIAIDEVLNTPRAWTVSQELTIVDGRGQARVVVQAAENGVGLTMYGRDGEHRIALGYDPLQGGLTVYDGLAVPRLSLLDTQDGPGLSVSDGEGRPMVQVVGNGPDPGVYVRAGSGVGAAVRLYNGEPGMVFYDVEQRPRFVFGMFEAQPRLELLDEAGQPRLVATLAAGSSTLQLSAAGDAQALLTVEDEAPRLALSVGGDTPRAASMGVAVGEPRFVLASPQGTSLMRVAPDGPALSFKNEDLEDRLVLGLEAESGDVGGRVRLWYGTGAPAAVLP